MGIPAARTLGSAMPPIDDAWDDVLPLVTQAARKVARKLSMDSSTREEFLEAASLWIVEKAPAYDPARGELGAFCFVVLLNKGKDLIKARSRRPRCQAIVGEVPCEGPREADRVESLDGLSAVIDAMDRHVRAIDCIMIAIDVQVMSEVEPYRVARWLESADVPKGFAWQDIEAMTKQTDRRRALANVLGMTFLGMKRRLCRALKKVRGGMGSGNA